MDNMRKILIGASLFSFVILLSGCGENKGNKIDKEEANQIIANFKAQDYQSFEIDIESTNEGAIDYLGEEQEGYQDENQKNDQSVSYIVDLTGEDKYGFIKSSSAVYVDNVLSSENSLFSISEILKEGDEYLLNWLDYGYDYSTTSFEKSYGSSSLNDSDVEINLNYFQSLADSFYYSNINGADLESIEYYLIDDTNLRIVIDYENEKEALQKILEETSGGYIDLTINDISGTSEIILNEFGYVTSMSTYVELDATESFTLLDQTYSINLKTKGNVSVEASYGEAIDHTSRFEAEKENIDKLTASL